MPDPPKLMWAWSVQQNGKPRDALALNQVPLPSSPPSGGNLLIRVTHAALNPADLAIFTGWIPFRGRPGLDFIGTVVGVGPKVPVQIKRLVSGMEVVGALGAGQVLRGWGSLAEYVVVPAESVTLRPMGLSTAQGLGCGVAGQTAVMVIKEAAVETGQKVLVNGASGGVGTILIQVLKAQGAHVVGICSKRNEELVKMIGIDEIIDYTAHTNLYEHLAETHGSTQFDLIIDCVGDSTLFTRCPTYLQPKGKFINIVGGSTQGVYPFLMNQLRPTLLGGTPRSYKILGLVPSGKYAHQIAQWIEEGLVKEVPIDSEYDIKDVVDAYEKLLTKRARGKIVIKIQD